MERYIVKVCLLGEGAVGKTSLIRRFVYDSFDDQYIKSIGAKVTKKKIRLGDGQTELAMMISDILGQMTNESLHASYLQGAKGIILVCDITRRETFDRLGSWLRVVKKAAGSPPMILLGNKSDIEERRQVEDRELEALANKLGCAYLPTSARTGLNVEKAFEILGQRMAPQNKKREEASIQMEQYTPRAPAHEPVLHEPDQAKDVETEAVKNCPKCGSTEIQIFPDGSGICEKCENLVEKNQLEKPSVMAKPQSSGEEPNQERSVSSPVDQIMDAVEKTINREEVHEKFASRMVEKRDQSSSTEAAFFNVPVAALRELKDRLSILLANREGSVESVMGEYGYDCGKAASAGMDVKCSRNELSHVLPDLWIGIGLSKVDVDSISEENIELAMYEMEIEEPDFFGGYLAGVVSGMLGEEFKFAISDMKDFFRIALEPGIQMKVALEEASTEAEQYFVDKGVSYIVKQKAEAFSIFKEKVTHGMEGLCITREYPPRVKEKYGLANTPVYWLSDSSSEEEEVFHPSRLAFEVKRALNEFMRESQSGIILLQGTEYLISHQSFSEILKWLQGLRDQGAMSGTTILICADPGAMDEKEFRNLSLEFPVLESR
ncbi:MAG: DUF835 domain-containing protein [Candidatus Thermoplasmatota archaeon]|nr:DUF835 domain-containing protein [Candidatus Thermoplasmatota archaeon]